MAFEDTIMMGRAMGTFTRKLATWVCKLNTKSDDELSTLMNLFSPPPPCLKSRKPSLVS